MKCYTSLVILVLYIWLVSYKTGILYAVQLYVQKYLKETSTDLKLFT